LIALSLFQPLSAMAQDKSIPNSLPQPDEIPCRGAGRR